MVMPLSFHFDYNSRVKMLFGGLKNDSACEKIAEILVHRMTWIFSDIVQDIFSWGLFSNACAIFVQQSLFS